MPLFSDLAKSFRKGYLKKAATLFKKKFVKYYMELYHEIQEDTYLIILAGNLDSNDANEINISLKKALKCLKSKIIVDCYNLNYISSAGIGVFLANLPSFKAHGIELTFVVYNLIPAKSFRCLA